MQELQMNIDVAACGEVWVTRKIAAWSRRIFALVGRDAELKTLRDLRVCGSERMSFMTTLYNIKYTH